MMLLIFIPFLICNALHGFATNCNALHLPVPEQKQVESVVSVAFKCVVSDHQAERYMKVFGCPGDREDEKELREKISAKISFMMLEHRCAVSTCLHGLLW